MANSNPNQWHVEQVKDLVEQRMDEMERRSLERFELVRDSIRVEREQIDKRFDAANRYKETYSETLTKLSNETLRREEVNARFASLQEKLDTLSRANWPLYSSFGGIAISMVVGLWVIIGLKIDATNQPVVVSLEQAKISNEARDRSIGDIRNEFIRQNQANDTEQSLKSRELSNLMQASEAVKADLSQVNQRLRTVESQTASSAVADANSQTDRHQLNDRTQNIERSMSDGMADRKSVEATLKASLVEVETQFCASDVVRNLMHANDLRILSILWQKTEMGTYPTDNSYYPNVCNRNVNTK